jgi:triphosphatase
VLPYTQSLTGMQDEVAFLNDAAVADRLLGDVSASRPELAPNVSFVNGFLAARANNGDKEITKLWRKFEGLGMPP